MKTLQKSKMALLTAVAVMGMAMAPVSDAHAMWLPWDLWLKIIASQAPKEGDTVVVVAKCKNVGNGQYQWETVGVSTNGLEPVNSNGTVTVTNCNK